MIVLHDVENNQIIFAAKLIICINPIWRTKYQCCWASIILNCQVFYAISSPIIVNARSSGHLPCVIHLFLWFYCAYDPFIVLLFQLKVNANDKCEIPVDNH